MKRLRDLLSKVLLKYLHITDNLVLEHCGTVCQMPKGQPFTDPKASLWVYVFDLNSAKINRPLSGHGKKSSWKLT